MDGSKQHVFRRVDLADLGVDGGEGGESCGVFVGVLAVAIDDGEGFLVITRLLW